MRRWSVSKHPGVIEELEVVLVIARPEVMKTDLWSVSSSRNERARLCGRLPHISLSVAASLAGSLSGHPAEGLPDSGPSL